MNVSEARAFAVERLTGADVPEPVRSGTPLLDADLLISRHLRLSRSSLMAHPEIELGEMETAFREDVERRALGEPVAYILGSKEFWGLSFSVTPAVLIPKPDTEILVERALSLLESLSPRSAVLDVCTGSGCIALSLAHERPSLRIGATDISAEALAVARMNAERLHKERSVAFYLQDLREGLPPVPLAEAREGESGWDLIVSNPPYVPSETADALLADGRREPRLALDGGADGLDLVRALAANALKALKPGGTLLVETGEYNAREAASYFERRGYCDIVVHKDLEGQDRVVEGRKPDE